MLRPGPASLGHEARGMRNDPVQLITWPLCGGTTAADLGDRLVFKSLLSKSVAFQKSSVPKLLVEGLHKSPRHHPSCFGFGFSCKSINFQSCLQAPKIRKTVPEASEKEPKSTPTSFSIDFCEQLFSKFPTTISLE